MPVLTVFTIRYWKKRFCKFMNGLWRAAFMGAGFWSQ